MSAQVLIPLMLMLAAPSIACAATPEPGDPNVGVFAGDGVKLELAASGEAEGVKEYVGRIDMNGGRQMVTAKGAGKLSGLIGKGDSAIIFTLEVSGDDASLRVSGKDYALKRGATVGATPTPPEPAKKPQPAQAPAPAPRPQPAAPVRRPQPHIPQAQPGVPPALIGYWRLGSGLADWTSINNGSFSAHGSMQSYTFHPNGTYEHVIYEKRNYQTIATYEAGVFSVRGNQIQFQAQRTDGFQEYNKRRTPLRPRQRAGKVSTWLVSLHNGHPFLTIDGVTRLARIR